eukprot:m.246709 g.246709  ORF g.246709 m.246709 type:complete len:213 (+) comp15144_c0_seq1:24-662(+)
MGTWRRLWLLLLALAVMGLLTRMLNTATDNLGHQPVIERSEESEPEDMELLPGAQASFYQLSASNIDGNEIKFESYAGKALLIVNVAPHDERYSLTQFAELQDLYDAYRSKGFEILAFPTDQFSHEKLSDEAIADYVRSEYHVSFQLMASVDVNGDNMSPVFKLLKRRFPGAIRSNFGAKFLINRKGEIVKRSRFSPKQLGPDIAALLQQTA